MAENLPKISVVMACFNSEAVIGKSLQSLRDQNYPQDLVEILVYDGGSTDKTREIAKSFGADVRDNPDTEPVAAKLKGYQQASGDLLIYVDTDEVHLNKDSLLHRAQLFNDHPEIQMAFSSGYSNPENYPFINRYINSYGDPFSQFIYRISKESADSVKAFQRHLHVDCENDHYVLFDVAKKPQNVLFENAAMGSTIRLSWFKSHFPELTNSRTGPVHMFYHMLDKQSRFAIFKDQAIEHYSADTLSSYLRKIKWRIVNNIFYIEEMGVTGYSGRKNLDSSFFSQYKRFFYLPYNFLIAPLVADSLLMVIKKRDPRFFIHIPLSLYTSTLIFYYYLLKSLGLKKSFQAYGMKTTIK